VANQDLAFAKQTLQAGSKEYEYFSLRTLEEKGFGKVQPLPYVIRIFLETFFGTKRTALQRRTMSGHCSTGQTA